MADYKLTYFDVKGFAEPMRFMFAMAKVQFVDERIPYNDEFPKLPEEYKQRCPWGQVPILEYKGTTIAQSSAILRFLARKFGFCGSDEVEAAKCDEFVDACKDYLEQWRPAYRAQGEERKKLVENFAKETTPEFLGKIEKHLEGKSFLVGSKVTWADLYIVHMVTMIEEYMDIVLTGPYENIKLLIATVSEIPEIMKFREETAHLNQSWVKYKQNLSK